MSELICDTCMHRCRLKPGQWGICRARKHEDGRIVCKNYGVISSIALDPIEKKPLAMFYPGSRILSVGSFGCNLCCPFCQNHEISMTGPEENADRNRRIMPQQLADLAERYRDDGNIGVAYTYNEPLIGWEYVLDTARLIRERGMKNVLVTNGSASLPVADRLLPYIDAANIDLKGFREDYYKKLGGSLQTVKEFIARAAGSCHVELTTLIVPGENDAPGDMEEEASWIASVDREIPLHITRFFPRYHMQDREATDKEELRRLAEIARNHLKNVFLGNMG